MGSNSRSRAGSTKPLRESTVKQAPSAVDKQNFTLSEEEENFSGTGAYVALKELYNGYIMSEVHDYISLEKGMHCLNIGCNSGAFLMDYALEYPNTKFTGVDPVPISEVITALPNVTFKLENVVDGLSLPDSSFDYIQVRTYANTLTRNEWPIVLKEVYRLLKPGGCVGFLEYESRETGNEDCAKVFIALRNLMESLNQEPCAGRFLKDWVVNTGLEHILTEETNVDCGPDTGKAKTVRWFWGECCTYIGPMLAPFLKVKAEDWHDFVADHLKDMEKYHGHITIIRVLARKPLK
ncbi:S-adenosyl-L-methionine-dependent methyltransferase [Mucor mucedo]|uniref:S-adenosyl-L-methionine-dependent methyltransferase n=1 Tax=Mucor mucedo TaxID=29922 RepID=UPI0022200523|nr:S-adenosyl-L-methionine-dependent methyltransferase [Mucor mucedo]KAI7892026.1 S-adenosyl-L-methionine-dependent methyltransferase [Mucor mucedo]